MALKKQTRPFIKKAAIESTERSAKAGNEHTIESQKAEKSVRELFQELAADEEVAKYVMHKSERIKGEKTELESMMKYTEKVNQRKIANRARRQ